MCGMGRREFVALLGGGAAAWPLMARAQQAAIPVVGFLRSTPQAPFQNLVTAFRQGLKETGFVEGQNVAVDYRYADNQIDRLPALVADLIHRPVAVIVSDNISAIVARHATMTVPIVFATGGDPAGSVSSDLAPTSPASASFPGSWHRNGWNCCARSYPRRRRLPCWLTRRPRRVQWSEGTSRPRRNRWDND